MTTLRVVLETLVVSPHEALARYTRELTRALIRTAPVDCDVDGIASVTSAQASEILRRDLPGIAGLHNTAVGGRELAIAWQLGLVGSSGSGLVHSPSLLAPLRRHSRQHGDQFSVTIHDVLPWTHPEWVPTSTIVLQKALLRRARKHADAVIVPSHTVAGQLADLTDLGDRIRVIPGAGRSNLNVPLDADERADRLNLPGAYILTSGSLHPREGVIELIEGLSSSGVAVPLLVLGAEQPPVGDAGSAPFPGSDIRFLGELDDANRSVVLSRAAAFVFPSRDDGFGAPILDALAFGIPVVHSNAPALLELTGDHAVIVNIVEAPDYGAALAEATAAMLADSHRRRLLEVSTADRVRLFSWRDTAEQVWRLHAEL